MFFQCLTVDSRTSRKLRQLANTPGNWFSPRLPRDATSP